MLFTLTNCNSPTIDKDKRDIIVKKYDLMKFPNIEQPILVTIDEFFDGNNDEASIAPNLDIKPKVSEYYRILKKLAESDKVTDAFVEINEVMIYDDGKLNDKEWFFADVIYFIGDIDKDEVREATKTLHPDEVDYDREGRIENINRKYKGKNVVRVWWD